MNYIAEPTNRRQLRVIADFLRKTAGMSPTDLRFPVLEYLEHKMPNLFCKFHCEIVPRSYFLHNIHAETDVLEHIIRIREDVYLGAIAGIGRDRMTITHEIAHYVLLTVSGIKLYRTFNSGQSIPAYRDPEWQAKALAGEIMCPYNLIHGMSVTEIADECGVSDQAAEYIAEKCK